MDPVSCPLDLQVAIPSWPSSLMAERHSSELRWCSKCCIWKTMPHHRTIRPQHEKTNANALCKEHSEFVAQTQAFFLSPNGLPVGNPTKTYRKQGKLRNACFRSSIFDFLTITTRFEKRQFCTRARKYIRES